jgi:hypothetical protein
MYAVVDENLSSVPIPSFKLGRSVTAMLNKEFLICKSFHLLKKQEFYFL